MTFIWLSSKSLPTTLLCLRTSMNLEAFTTWLWNSLIVPSTTHALRQRQSLNYQPWVFVYPIRQAYLCSRILLIWFSSSQIITGSNMFASPELSNSSAWSCRLNRNCRTQWYHIPRSLAQSRCFSVFLYSEFSSLLGLFQDFSDGNCENLSCMFVETYFNGFSRFRGTSVSCFLHSLPLYIRRS